MTDETREEIIAELRAYKEFNTDWQQDIEKSKVVASYNNRLASMAAPGIDDYDIINITECTITTCLLFMYC